MPGDDRFPPEVLAALTAAGWQPGRRDEQRGRDWALRVAGHVGPDGRQHTVVGPAIEAYAEFGGLYVEPDGPGEAVAPSTVHLDPLRAVHTVATLAVLADTLGVPVSPLGVEADGTGVLAIDARQRVFVLDHGGDWFIGRSVEQAVTVLVLGQRPHRLAEDGSW
ncbi:SUKH-3 immunity protein of toxin-antitoxin system [Micromonospora sp. Llam0]|uniref:SUKH-3 domain-containing protein n=1 Tax=Micromonospora sp. Llam0 TaxID=2485143 RepID=UPI000F478279|nr:SUKH-3 domain-containing protein [Micromonospora sp. Llam0]ROO63373.1 SUKH-3 immunity protein of toxin-antitoxin system [Micromonospora sp. Llam0]